MNRDENLVALSVDFHTHSKYQEFYEMFGRRLGGFVGMYETVIDLADALTIWEEKATEPWTHYEWVILCQSMADIYIRDALTTKELPNIVRVLNSALLVSET